ncbi:MAG: hypothetical protein QGG64_18945, partial [Candidatus Latescibacteria bacterium]|nr:hypothetical protein [Candidatus Latescibacterota bacterium]
MNFTARSPEELSPTGNPFDPDECGVLIGVGSQYTVHDLGNGRVVKIPNSMDGSRGFVGGWRPDFSSHKSHIPIDITAFFRDESVPHVLRLA